MLTKNQVDKVAKEYRDIAEQVKALETRKGKLKDTLLEEIGVKGGSVLEGEKFVAVLSTYNRESVALKELLAEFGRELLESKKLLNSYPVNSLTVKEKK